MLKLTGCYVDENWWEIFGHTVFTEQRFLSNFRVAWTGVQKVARQKVAKV